MIVSLGMVLVVLAALAAGAGLGWWLGRLQAESRAAVAAADAESRRTAAMAEQDARRARLEAELDQARKGFDERLRGLQDAEARLTTVFESLSGKALESSARHLLELAAARFDTLKTDAGRDLAIRQTEISGLISPMKETLQKLEQALAAVEQARAEDKGRLSGELSAVSTAQQELRDETRRLTTALRVPHVRGRWGEMQLQRVVELAGMAEHCDFRLQPSLDTGDGVQRPDMIVTLPGGRSIVVDAKAPVTAYLDAIALDDDAARQSRLRDHAALVKGHVAALGAKQYWDRLECTPDFVVLFLPGESFFSAAVQQDPGLFEFGVGQRVFLAGPFTLLALLRAVAHGWNQQRLADNARAISDLGRELYDRITVMADHLSELRRSLQRTVEAHNAAVASLESRVLPSARKFRDLGIASTKDIETLAPVEQTPRRARAAELTMDAGVEPLDAELVAGLPAALDLPKDD